MKALAAHEAEDQKEIEVCCSRFYIPLVLRSSFRRNPFAKGGYDPWFTASTTRECTGRSCFEYPVEEVVGSQVYIYYNLLYYALGYLIYNVFLKVLSRSLTSTKHYLDNNVILIQTRTSPYIHPGLPSTRISLLVNLIDHASLDMVTLKLVLLQN
ncbi:hypothetical protein BC629DRAFT_458393 [Irpex lacteus]|nr:hypothetical protein BC629DRAFT_458393 [Irpex lacteus]